MSFRCQECGYRSPKWLGRCPQCGNYGTFVEEKEAPSQIPPELVSHEPPKPLPEVPAPPPERLSTGMPEVDRVLGGLVPGAVVLFGGEPGIGKSTLLLQIAANLAERYGKVLYVSGEEAPPQIKLRAQRLGHEPPDLFLLSSQDLLAILDAVSRVGPIALVVDSLQTVLANPEGGEVGSLAQVRETAAQLSRVAKTAGIVTFLVSHITKEGGFAGPKTVEHLVDVAVYLEGIREGDLRILRCVKNRYGSTAEVAVLEMTGKGLVEVPNPSLFFISKDTLPRPGTAVVPILEGTRTLLVEIQALVTPAGSYGPPQRRMAGLDVNRTLVLLAVIEKHLGVHTRALDVYLAVAGGLEVTEPAADLGICAAILSSLRDRPIPPDTVILGEVGLGGDLRPVRKGPERLSEVAKLGFRKAVVANQPLPRKLALEVVRARTLREAMEALELM